MITAVSEQEEREALVESCGVSRYVPLAIWLIAIMALAWIPFRIVSLGYLPPDDALRHAAKAVTQRPWSEILVLREDFQTDHNPGWHWLLGQVHQWSHLGTDGLVVFSVVSLFLVVSLAPMVRIKRPEAWLGALLVFALMYPSLSYRMLLGRPLALTVGATLLILLLWRRVNSARPSSTLLLVTTSLLAASAWVHGSWYLFGLVVAAFGLAGQRKAALWLGGCWLAGSFAGAFLTGHPIAFLTNAIRIALNCFSGNTLQRFLAFEFLPSDGNIAILFAVGGLLLWRYATGHWDRACVNDPVFLLGVLGWMLGLRVSRFYADWGAPALLLWMALELSEHAERLLAYHSLKRFIVSAALAFSLLFAVTADTNGRWTNSLFIEFLSEADTEMKPWLPEEGGVLYSSDMTVFYQTFFKNPDAKWRYMLGFEPTFMPPDDLRIYRNFQMNLGSYKAYEPWIAKMGLRDRLVVRSGSPAAPGIPGLEWHYAARELWIGRKARLQVEPGDSTSQPRGIKADR